jgi:Ca2+-binding RTX toxin-like protein
MSIVSSALDPSIAIVFSSQDIISGDVSVVEPGSVDNGDSDAIVGGTRKADVLLGGGGNDTLDGGRGNDRLNGQSGDDVMTGGRDNDTFVFGPGFGDDVIRDFDANARGGQDLLDVSALGVTAEDFDARVVIEDLGKNTLVTIGDHSILLLGVDGKGKQVITESDFLLS